MEQSSLEKTIDTYNETANIYREATYELKPTEELPLFCESLPPSAVVLDAGCGYGRELKYFIDKGFEAHGVDLSQNMLSLARSEAPTAKLETMDIQDLKFEDRFFDGIWSRGSLHHLLRSAVPKTLNGFNRILKPNGLLLVVCWEGEGEIIRKDDLTSGKERLYTLFREEELRNLVGNAGFKTVKSYTYNEIERYGTGRDDAKFVVILAREKS